MFAVANSLYEVMPFFAEATAYYVGGIFILRGWFGVDVQKLVLTIGTIQFGTQALSIHFIYLTKTKTFFLIY